MATIGKPEPAEYGEFFAGYVDKVPSDSIIDFLQNQLEEFNSMMQSVSEQDASRVDEPYTWTLKQVVGHLIDGEKVFGYRLHCFACGDPSEFPGFSHEPYVAQLDYQGVTLQDLVEEFSALRRANLLFLRRLSDEHWSTAGIASDSRFTVRGKAFVMGGHVQHHLEIIQKRIEK